MKPAVTRFCIASQINVKYCLGNKIVHFLQMFSRCCKFKASGTLYTLKLNATNDTRVHNMSVQIGSLENDLAFNPSAVTVLICHWLKKHMLMSDARHIFLYARVNPWGARNLQFRPKPSAFSTINVKWMNKSAKKNWFNAWNLPTSNTGVVGRRLSVSPLHTSDNAPEACGRSYCQTFLASSRRL